MSLDNFVKNLHNADIAEIIQNLDDESRLKFILKVKNYFDPEILTYLNDSIRDEIIEQLDIKQLASNASALDVDDAVDVIEDLEESDKEVFLDNISESERELIKEGLNYPEDSAGRLMQREFVSIDLDWNVGDAIDFLRKKGIAKLQCEEMILKNLTIVPMSSTSLPWIIILPFQR